MQAIGASGLAECDWLRSEGARSGVLDPRKICNATRKIGASRHRKEQVAQSIEKLNRSVPDRIVFVQRDQQSFGSATDRPCDMQVGCESRSAWKYERSNRFVPSIDFIDKVFRFDDMSLSNARDSLLRGRPGWSREVRTQVEESRLKLGQHSEDERLSLIGLVAHRRADPQPRIQFINGAIRLDTRVVLHHATTTVEPGCSIVTSLCIELH